MVRKPAIGIDLGATNTRIGLVSYNGRLLKSTKVFSKTPKDLVRQLKSFIDRKIEGIGIGVPGPLNLREGRILNTPNLIAWRQTPIVKILKEHFQTKVYLERDTNVSLLGEAWKGVAQEKRNVVMLTLGTGVGGAIMINGHIYHGTHGVGAELGHMKISDKGPKCGCGNIGDLEAFLGARGTREQFEISQPELIDKVLAGDKKAIKIAKKLGEILGIGIGNLINIFDPQLIIIGGGVAKIGDHLLDPARESARKVALVTPLRAKIVTWQLGDDSGIFGGAKLVFEEGRL
jgi:glucokinase